VLGKPENLRVELFGNVRTHQSPAFNHHLQHQLQEFDRLYQIHGGHIGSPGHQFDRMEFARIVSEGMLNDFKHNDGTFTMLETETSFNCASISCEMNIKTKTTFGNDAAPVSSMPFYEPN
jgi:hypothetical protein